MQILDFKRFIKNLLLFGSPLLLLVLSYFVFDPFHVLYAYKSYPDNYAKSLNRDRISTQMFLNENPTHHFQSFIFGNSRSSVFYCEDWSPYIHDPTPFHFDASCETISGIDKKMIFLDKNGNNLKNALFVFDIGTFEYEQDTMGSVFVQDCRVSDLSPLRYHEVFFNTYFSSGFFLRYLDYKIFGEYRPYMNKFLENRKINYTPVVNNFVFSSYEDSIRVDSVKYFTRPQLFYDRPTTEVVKKAIVQPYQLQYLRNMKSLLDKYQTNYKIVIAPMFNQYRFNPADLKILQEIFGANHVFDYSGINEFTNNKYNYYEIYHFRPKVARAIMKQIYE